MNNPTLIGQLVKIESYIPLDLFNELEDERGDVSMSKHIRKILKNRKIK